MKHSLEESRERFIGHCKYERNLSPLTIKAYQIDLGQFLGYVGQTSSPEEIDKEQIKCYMRHMFEKGLKETSVRRKMICIKTFFHFLECDDLIETSPFHKLRLAIKLPNRLPNVMNLKEVEHLLNISKDASIKRLQAEPGANDAKRPDGSGAAKRLQDNVILELLFATGMRVGELAKLNLNDIDTSRGVIKVSGKGSRDRIVPIPHLEVGTLIESFIGMKGRTQGDNQSLLSNRSNKRMSAQSIRSIVKKYVQLAQLKKRVTPHTFRHTIATLLLEGGTDIRFVQCMLGHHSLATTQIYTHVSETAQRKAILMNHPRNLLQSPVS